MTLTPELIEQIKKEVQFEQYYEPSETCTPKHIMHKDFIEHTEWRGLSKLIYYILMDEVFPNTTGKAETGELGYFLKLKTN